MKSFIIFLFLSNLLFNVKGGIKTDEKISSETAALQNKTDTEVIIVKEAPPPPKAEKQSRKPGKDYIWIPGYWIYKNGKWEWVKSKWEKKPKKNSVYKP